MAPKRKSSDAGSASKPKRNRDAFQLVKNENSGYEGNRKKKSFAEIAKLYGKNGSSIREEMKNK